MPLHIINREILLQKDISDDPQTSSGKVDIHTLETRDAGALDIQDVIGWGEGVLLATEDET